MSLGQANAGVGTGGGDGNSGAGAQNSGGGASTGGSSTGTTTNTGTASGGGNTGVTSTGGGAGAGAANANGALGSAGQGEKTWRDALPDELKSDPTLNKYSDLTNLAKAHIELQKKIGQKGIFKPAAGASAEEIKAFREALGIPTSPDKYDLGDFGDVKVDPTVVDWAKKAGAEHGVEPAALKAIVTDYMKLESQNRVAQEMKSMQEQKAGLEGLKTEWGDAYDQNIQKANFVAQKMGGQALIDALKKYGAHNDPTILRSLANEAKMYGEHTLREGGINNGRVTPGELDAKIAQVQSRMFTLKPTDGAYASLKLEYESLWKQKTGGR